MLISVFGLYILVFEVVSHVIELLLNVVSSIHEIGKPLVEFIHRRNFKRKVNALALLIFEFMIDLLLGCKGGPIAFLIIPSVTIYHYATIFPAPVDDYVVV